MNDSHNNPQPMLLTPYLGASAKKDNTEDGDGDPVCLEIELDRELIEELSVVEAEEKATPFATCVMLLGEAVATRNFSIKR